MDKNITDYILEAETANGEPLKIPFLRKKRAGEYLTREQIKAIRKGRKMLRKELKDHDLNKKEDMELTASSMGLYFDKGRFLAWLEWLFHGRALWALVGAVAGLMAVLFLYSTITQMQGHFTINMTDNLFREGFVLSETKDFKNVTTSLFCEPAKEVPCISMSQIPENVDKIDGQHNDNYFAYTFYIRNDGESTVDYDWYVRLNSESKNLSSAAWVMIFEDGKMRFYAEAGDDGKAQAMPSYDDERGLYYLEPALRKYAADPKKQYELIQQVGDVGYYRAIPFAFEEGGVVARGTMMDVTPGESHKYTVVIWLEGDDPHCTNELIGGHIGMDFNFKLLDEEEKEGNDNPGSGLDQIWDNLTFWDN